jgi:hypothetical protein
VLSGGGGQRVYLEVAGWLYPGGARVGAPEASDPPWRGPDGRSHKLGEVLAGLGEASRELILATHAEAVGEIVPRRGRGEGLG